MIRRNVAKGVEEWENVPGVLGIFSFNSIKENGKWVGNGKYFYIFFIEVDLWLILFFKVANTGGMGNVPIPGIPIYSRH